MHEKLQHKINMCGFAAISIALICLSGCATIVKGTTQKVPVASDPPDADVIVDGNLSGQTPTTVVKNMARPG